jgi:hypothetical protein
MQVMGFPKEYINLVKLLFVRAKARVNVNGSPTEYFPLGQDIR